MNPVLSSTADFNRYLESRLATNRGTQRNVGTRATGTAQKGNRIESKATTAARQDVDSSNSFLQINAQKYEVSSQDQPTRPSTANHTRGSRGSDSTARPSTARLDSNRRQLDAKNESVDIVHSWKQYVSAPERRALGPLTVDVPQPKPSVEPVGHSPWHEKRVSEEYGMNTGARYIGSERIDRESIEDNAECVADPFVDVRLRTGILRRLFVQWRNSSRASRASSQQKEWALSLAHSDKILQEALRSWFFIAIACRKQTATLRIRMRKSLRKWKRTAVDLPHSLRRAEQFYEFDCIFKALEKWKSLLLYAANRRQKKAHQLLSYRFRARYLLLWTFSEWKSRTQVSKREKSMLAEQELRRSKISSLLQRIDHKSAPPQPPIVSARSNDEISTKAREVTVERQTVSGSRRAGGIAAAVPPNGSRGNTVQSSTTPSGGNSRSGSKPIAERVVTGSIRNDAKPTSARRSSTPNKSNASRISLVAAEKGTEISRPDCDLPAPPSYRHFAADGENKEAFDVRDLQESVRDMQTKNKLHLLREQTMNRVHLRRQSEERKMQEKLTQEADAVARLREEAKRLREAEKQKSVRTIALKHQLDLQCNTADDFRRKHLLVSCGFAPWNRYVQLCYQQMLMASEFRVATLLRKFWQLLVGAAKSAKTERVRNEYRFEILASSFYKKRLLRRVWTAWKVYRKTLRANAIALRHLNNRKFLLKRCLHGWQIAYERAQREWMRKFRSAKPLGDKCVLAHCFRRWEEFMDDARVSREIERRAQRKWADVQNWMKK